LQGFVGLKVVGKDKFFGSIGSRDMKKNKLIKALGGKDFVAAFSFLFLSAAAVVWCLTSALIGPLEHLSCNLLPVC
jgi:hypothetical protein